MAKRKTIVIALGGNALLRSGENATLEKQFKNAQTAMEEISKISSKYNIVITHGNGPQVGAIVIRSELAAKKAYEINLSTAVAESEGELGYIIQQALYNELAKKKPVVSLLTQFIVDKNDPAFHKPTKPIGPFYTKEQALALRKKGMHVINDAGRGWRRVVASPMPKKIIEAETIKKLAKNNTIVIAAGGGGIPVVKEKSKHKGHWHLQGIDAVIDKDRASALLASDIKSDMLIMLTGVDMVALNYGKSNEKKLDKITAKDAKKYLSEGHFAEGSMGPKIEAAIYYLKHNKNGRVIITLPEKLEKALRGEDGTVIVNEKN